MDSAPTSTPLASVIIVTWNAKRYADECLRSLRQNTDIPVEIIVVDNASTDGTAELVQERFPEVCLIQTGENLGFAKGNNVGIARSRGRYLCLVNSDVNVPPGCLRKLIAYMEANPTVGMLGPQMLGPNGEVRRSSMRFPTVGNMLCRALALDAIFKGSRWAGGVLMSDFTHDRTADVEVLNGWFWVVRREALEQVGPLDDRFFMYGEDLDWCYRFHRAGWRLVFYAGAGAVHHGGASSAAAPIRFYIEMQRANFQYWEKHHGWLSRCANYFITVIHELARIGGYAVVCLLKPGARGDAVYKIRRSLALLRWLFGLKMAHLNLPSSPGIAEPRQS
jgi:GT2 family glycosyltransferase